MTPVDVLGLAFMLGVVTFLQRELLVTLRVRRISDLVRITAAKDRRIGEVLGVLLYSAMQLVGLTTLFREVAAVVRIGLSLLIAGTLLGIALKLARKRSSR
jgi:hypothetical protein